MIKLLDAKNRQTAKRILDISLQSYEVEANVIGAKNFPPLNEKLSDILTSTNLFYGFFSQGSIVAIIEFEDEGTHWLIARLVVSPNHFRKGIGSKLINFAKEEFRNCIVSTADNNIPAVALYEKHGFVKLKESTKVKMGIKLVRLKQTET